MGRLPLLLAFIAASILYVSWRFTTLNLEALTFSVLFLVAEIFTIISFLVFLITTVGRHDRKAPTPQKGLTVDVFVPTYNEPVHVVRPTLLAARQLQYPHETWLLDDGNREEMRLLAEELGCRYLVRDNNLHAKAGNLNNGLKYAKGDFLTVFDADHVAQPDFLDKLLGYFEDEKVSFVQTPQDYYNDNAFLFVYKPGQKLLLNEQRFFFRFILPARDFWNGAYSCGSGCVFRRRHLEEVGGFAVETVTEDFHTSIRLHRKGYKSIYHDEPLCYGIAAQQVMTYLRQRLRWGQGTMRTGFLEKIPFSRGLTIGQRLCYLSSLFAFISGWQRLFFFIAPIYVLFTNTLPIRTGIDEYLIVYVPYLLFLILTFKQLTNGHGRMLALETDQMASFFVFCIATFSYFTKRQKFWVTPKGLAGKWRDLIWLTPQALIILGTVSGIALGSIRYLYSGTMSLDILLVVSFWGLLNTSFAIEVLRDAIRCEGIKEDKYLFTVPVPIEIDKNDKKFLTIAAGLNREKMLINKQKNDVWTNEKHISGRIFLPEGPVTFIGEVDGNVIHFNWDDIAAADKLDLSLHNCSWHRLFLGYRLKVKTPGQWLRFIFGLDKPREGGFSGEKFVLFRNTETDDDWLLGGCSMDKDFPGKIRLLVWGTEAVPAYITIKNIEPDFPEYICKVEKISPLGNNMNGMVVQLTILNQENIGNVINKVTEQENYFHEIGDIN